MAFGSQYRFGPGITPKPLKYLILATVLISFFAGLTDHLIPHYFGWDSPQQLLSLSKWGIDHLYLWQLVSYVFVHPLSHGITFSFILSLAFNAYILWIIGAALIEKKGLLHFFSLYFLGTLFTGVILSIYQSAIGSPLPFAGNGPALYTLLIAWLCLFPHAEFLLFLAIPLRASWLILGILGLNILIDISTGDWQRVIAYLCSAGFGALYYRVFWREKNAMPLYTRTKLYDFKTGKAILNDDEFLNEMLTRIALKGRSSLTWREKWRLNRISRRKKREK